MRRRVQLEQQLLEGEGEEGGTTGRGVGMGACAENHELGAIFGLHEPLRPPLFLPSSPFT